MFMESVHRIRQLAETTLIESTWAQWSVLAAIATPVGQERAWTIVDPEALVLASYAVTHRERRLNDVVRAWAEGAAHLMSLQRMLSLSKHYPQEVANRLTDFADAAVAGGDRRWLKLTGSGGEGEIVARKKRLGELRLISGPALTLRLRAGFGVGAKADLLSFLIGLGGTADVRMIAAATAFTTTALRAAADEMTLAGFIHEIEGRPVTYYADVTAWAQLLQADCTERPRVDSLPRWRFWSAIFLFLARVIEWAEAAQHGNWTEYVVSSRAYDLYENHRRQLKLARVEFPVVVPGRGSDYASDFEDLVRRVQSWTNESLYPFR